LQLPRTDLSRHRVAARPTNRVRMEARQKRLKGFATVNIILEQPSHGSAESTETIIQVGWVITHRSKHVTFSKMYRTPLISPERQGQNPYKTFGLPTLNHELRSPLVLLFNRFIRTPTVFYALSQSHY